MSTSHDRETHGQLAGDIDAQHQDIVVPGGLLGPLDRGLQPVEGKGPAVVAERVQASPDA